ncbi:CTD kinase subunit beta [Colletotrichum siamense]|uniref:RNA polymerase II holoenzyme cyclin-like subunit n=2 Tax=Colletotrichum gloeosporioides species complex TaxID=2707338 RepID=A0A9P5ET44_COLSI|nr:CTD kinase subunit beta [Colletotrichum siamense]KAF4858953.1 CTD kinase subunit beta [Colletotrichum siamense]
MQFSKVLYVLFPVAVLAAPLQTFNIPTMDPNTVAPEVPAIGKRVPQAEDTCTDEGLLSAWCQRFNNYEAPLDLLGPHNATETLDAWTVSGVVRVLVGEDRTVFPPRLRLRIVEHEDWRLWSVQTKRYNWHVADAGPPPPFITQTLAAEIYTGALEHIHYRVTDATRQQISLLPTNEILDLPLDGDAVFHCDYSFLGDPYDVAPVRSFAELEESEDDEDDEPEADADDFENESSDTKKDNSSSTKQDESQARFSEGKGGYDSDYDIGDADESDLDESGSVYGDGGSSIDVDEDVDQDEACEDSVVNHESCHHDHNGAEPCTETSEDLIEFSSSSNSSDDDPFYLERRYATVLMAPSGPKAQQQAAASNNASTNSSTPAPAAEPQVPKGPHPGHIQVSCQYTSEQRLRRMLRDNKSDPAREDSYRLQGVQLIDNVRNVLHVPVKTFDTACVYYHWFRLSFRDAEYNYQDAAMASLFLACKVEDTIKKSKEILCAAYNIKNPDHPTTQDDKMFEQPSKIVIGLERLILETVGFDFRCRYPQASLQKVTKQIMGADAKEIFAIAMEMSIDLYKTFAPIKQPSFAMALALLELTARLLGTGVDKIEKVDLSVYHTTRQNIVETMLDLLDLYTQHLKSTKLGNRFDLNKFIEVKIVINSEVDNDDKLVRYAHWCNNCDGGEDENLSNGVSVLKNISFFGSNSAKRNGRNQDGTMRFVFDPEQARCERREVEPYFKDEYEDYEVEVEVPMEPEGKNHNHRDMKRDGGWGGGRRNHHHDRRKGRGYY